MVIDFFEAKNNLLGKKLSDRWKVSNNIIKDMVVALQNAGYEFNEIEDYIDDLLLTKQIIDAIIDKLEDNVMSGNVIALNNIHKTNNEVNDNGHSD